MHTFTLLNFEILSTGVDGGHKYVRSELLYDGLSRTINIFFRSKKDENALVDDSCIIVKGTLIDDGIRHSLILQNADLIYIQRLLDSRLLDILRKRHGLRTLITLKNQRIIEVYNIAEGYDLGEEYRHLTTNISPEIEGCAVDLISTNHILKITFPETGVEHAYLHNWESI